MTPEEKRPNPIDLHVGERVRLRRRHMGLSQEGLADRIGLTFQQVQKYERGANRISASKLFEISTALQVPVEYFFDGCSESELAEGFNESETGRLVHYFLTTAEGIELAAGFPRIRSPKHRRKLLELVRSLADE
ncbi:MAG: helix-turn-helix transcriptional regulator [Asticcacaulis sp.]|uniref:helix-turn-helix domain-containing protein n=1 Tax=Asticcacaulis sp. TaxID=1872648 RepID=UPI0039E46307